MMSISAFAGWGTAHHTASARHDTVRRVIRLLLLPGNTIHLNAMTFPFILGVMLMASRVAMAAADPIPRVAWTRVWDSPAHSHDMAWGLAVTPGGRVYVSGWSARPDLKDGSNAWLGAYETDGRLAWVREQNSPAAFDGWHSAAVDPAGGVFVTGASFRP